MRSTLQLILGLLTLWSVAQPAFAQAPNSFASTGSLATGRYYHSSTLLPTGKVLVAGGIGNTVAVATAEVYDPAVGTWTATGSMAAIRRDHSATLLPNGKVLVAGGFGSATLATAELYDPATGTWTATGNLAVAREFHTATLLPNGKVLVTGGYNGGYLASAELYDPATGMWTSAGNLATTRQSHTATLLPNGKVLVAGGYNGASVASAQLYDPATGAWTTTGSLATSRRLHTATLLPNGKVLAAGGITGSIAAASAELYDPAAGTWTTTGTLASGRQSHSASLLPNGKVIVTGGHSGSVFMTSAEVYDSATGTWTATGSLATARYLHTATLLPSGKVLVAGGTTSNVGLTSVEMYEPASGTWAVTTPLAVGWSDQTLTLLASGKVLQVGGDNSGSSVTAYLYDVATGAWTATGTLTTGSYHTATLLPNGKVLVAGGFYNTPLATASLYDPTSGTWSATGSMSTARYGHTATLLPDGKVLVAAGGGSSSAMASAEIYDSAMGTWTTTGSLTTAREYATATLLANGKVLVVGGSDGSSELGSAELYDPTTGTWISTAPLSVRRSFHTATLLPSGKVLAAGGWQSGGAGVVLANAELYDPASGTWTATSSLATGRDLHQAVLMPSGKVLVCGGNKNGSLASAELYDPAAGTWMTTGSLATARDSHSATLLPNGKVLVAAGTNTGTIVASSELFEPGLGFSAGSQPQIASAAFNASGQLVLTGSNFKGVSGSSSGNVLDSATNFPTVQLRWLENEQSTFLQPDAALAFSATNFTSRAGVAGSRCGHALITVFANGIPSTAVIVEANSAPTLSILANQTINEDGNTGAIGFTVSDMETAVASLTVTGSSSNTALVPNANIVFGGSGANRTLTVTPAADLSGTATITVTVSDGLGSAARQFLLTVNPVNDAPTISDIGDQMINEDADTGTLPFSVGDIDNSVSLLTVTATSSNVLLVPNSSISLARLGAGQWGITVTPVANRSGTTTITVTVSDGSAPASDTFVLGVNAVNDAPTITDLTNQTINEDGNTGALAFTVGDVETAAGSLTVTGSSSNTALVPNGNILFGGSGASRTVTVTPTANASGAATITVTVSDGTTTGSDTFVVTVTAVNDAPTITDIVDQTINEDGTSGALGFTVGDAETATASLTVTGSSSNTALVPNGNIVFGGSGASRTVTVTPVAGATGTATLTVNVSDGTATASDTFVLIVSAKQYHWSTFAGFHAGAGIGSTDGTGSAARFSYPYGVAVDGNGNVYVADTNSGTIRKVTNAGIVTTLAGTAGSLGSADGTGSVARFSSPQAVAVDGSGNVYVADTNNSAIRKITSAGVVSTLAGTAGSAGSMDGTGSATRFYAPQGVAVDNSANVYVADTYNHTIRKITSAGVVTTLAGTAGSTGSTDGTGSAARFNNPYGVAVDGTGNVYVGDSQNKTIRKITSAGVVTTLAGTAGGFGSADGIGSAARFSLPRGVTVDGSGNVYVADFYGQAIRKITSAGVVTTLAGGNIGGTDGTGSAARFYYPNGVAVDGSGNVYVGEAQSPTIRKVTGAGVVTTVAGIVGETGSTDGPASAARFDSVYGAARDNSGNIYVADYQNTIRKVTPAGQVTTMAGLAGTSGSSDGLGSAARFNFPVGVAVDSSGNVIIGDWQNNTIRKISPAGVVTTFAGTAGVSGSTDATGSAARFLSPAGVAVDNDGNIYVAEWDNHTVRKITPAGEVTTLAGTAGALGSTDGAGSAARFGQIEGIAVDGSGNLFVADWSNSRIRKVTAAGVVTTLAVLASQPRFVAVDAAGNVYATADSHTIYKITSSGVATVLAGTISKRGATEGSGSVAQFYSPQGLVLDSNGNFYVADLGNHRIVAGRDISTNAAPTISAISDQVTLEDTAAGPLTVPVGDAETAASLLTVTATSLNTTLIPQGNLILGGSGANRTLTATPATNQNGSALVYVTVSDGNATASSLFRLTVAPTDDAPMISDIADRSVNEDTSTGAVSFTIGDAETSASVLTVSGSSSNQALVPDANITFGGSGSSRTVTVTPAANASGTTSITVTVSDGGLTTSDAFLLTVNAVNDAPTITDIANQAINEDGNSGTLAFAVGDVETAAASLTVTGSSSNTALVPNANIVFGGSAGSRTVTVTPAANASGSAAITVTVSDGSLTASDTFVLAVNAVNDAPTLAAIANPAAILEDAGDQTVNLSGVSAGGGETQTLTVTATSSNTALIPNPTVTYTSPNATGSLSYTPVANASGTAVVTVTVNDGQAANNTTTQAFTVTVTAVNDAPTLAAIANPAAILEDAGVQTVNLSGISAGGGETQTLTVTAVSSNTTLIPNPTVTYTSPNATGSLSYTPVANASGTAVITVTVNDGQAANNTTTQSFTVTVTAVNDAPTLAPVADPAAILEDAGTQTVSLSGLSAGGGETQTLTVTAASSNTALIPNPTVTYTSPNATGSLSYTPVANANGTAVITITVTDSGGTASGGVNSVSRTFNVTVTPVNDAPVVQPATVNVQENTTIGATLATVTATDADPGQTLSYAILAGNTGSTFAINRATGAITLARPLDFETVQTYALSISATDDGSPALAGNATVTINVSNVNDPPTVAVDGTGPSVFTDAASATVARSRHTATLLSDGKVLVAGGNGGASYLASAELYEPATNTWTAAGNLATARYAHTATLLASGKVLVTGGSNGGTSSLASAELYDPATNIWSAAGSLTTGRHIHTATLLADGRVLVAGGVNGGISLSTAELYDPATNTWSAAGSLLAIRNLHTATLLSSGKVLVAGGRGGSGSLATAELYDPATNAWSAAGLLATSRDRHVATLLPDGKVLVVAGINGNSFLSSAELYDPATNTWSAAGALAIARYYHTATLLPGGKVLVAGGTNSTALLASAELYDPATNSWTAAGNLSAGRYAHAATLLPSSGKVLLTHGTSSGYLASAELYGPAALTTTASEGSDTVQTGTFSDPDGNATVTLTASYGTVTQNNAEGTWSWTATGADGPATSAITITATDAASATETAAFTFTVTNAAPTVTIDAPALANEDATVSFTFTATDPSALDQATGFAWTLNYGDGTDAQSLPAATTSPLARTHTFAQPGTFNVTATARDKDGGTSAVATKTITIADATAPVIAPQADIGPIAATGPDGAVVTFNLTAQDAIDGNVAVACLPASGSTFPLGTTTVNATAVDSQGNTATSSFNVTVTDQSSPRIVVPADLVVDATSPAGAVVNFTISADDTVDGMLAVTPDHASGSIFAIGHTTVNVTATDSHGNIASASFVVTVRPGALDTVAPTVKITTPATGAVSGTFTIGGTVKENLALDRFTVRLNGVALPLTVNPMADFVKSANVPWSVAGALPENGPNLITVEAVDLNGRSATVNKTVTYITDRPEIAGTYNALLVPTDTPSIDTAGLITLTVTRTGSFTGKAFISGVAVGFSGVLKNDDEAGHAVARFKPALGTALELIDRTEFDGYLGALELSVSEQTGLSGTLSTQTSDGTVLGTFAGKRASYSSANPVPAALLNQPTKGLYTLILPAKEQTPAIDVSLYPQGTSVATVTVTNTGNVSVAGYLADGTKYAAASKLRSDGSAPLYAQLYRKLGSVGGELTFGDLPNSDVIGNDFLWLRPAVSRALYYPAGWPNGLRLDALGTKYANPASLDFGQGAADLVNGNASLIFTDGGLTGPVTKAVSLNPGPLSAGEVKLIPATSKDYTLKKSASSGGLSGTFTHTDGKLVGYRGILLNKGTSQGGFGYFLSAPPATYNAAGQSGSVILAPAHPNNK